MKFQAIVLASFLVMPYALADDQGGLTRENGLRFREAILSRGNSEDLERLYRQWRGKAPQIMPMLQHRGLNI